VEGQRLAGLVEEGERAGGGVEQAPGRLRDRAEQLQVTDRRQRRAEVGGQAADLLQQRLGPVRHRELPSP
jgi:hypothetical protein